MLTTEMVNNLVKWLYNTPRTEQFKVVYGEGHHPNYVDEKMPLFGNLVDLWAKLDPKNREKLIDAVNKKYGG